jgi:hypothetical protein
MFLNHHRLKNNCTNLYDQKNLGMRALWIIGLTQFFISIHNHSYGGVPGRYDVVIDEIMADPTPAIGLPSSEYIELKNVSMKPYDLFKWKISDESSTATVSIHFVLMPDSYVIICPSSAAPAFTMIGPTIGVSSFPSLNNDEDIISVVSPEGKLIHAVHYSNSWYNNAVKSDGGWSLEMIDTHNPCTGTENWKASNDASGGTPGRKNSVDAIEVDQRPPALKRCFVQDSNTIVLIFDEPLDSNIAVEPDHYLLEGLGKPGRIVALPPLFTEISLQFLQSMQKGIIYHITVNGVTDCSNNMIGQMNTARVGIADEADSMDLVINEILFDPKPGGFDYVELFNRSKKIIDASHLFIANRSSTGSINAPKKMINTPYLIFPGDYIVITENIEKVESEYLVKNPGWMIQLSGLPSFPNDQGAAVVMNQQGVIIDELKYDVQWQFPLIKNAEGVALERIDPFAPTQQRSNWTSAAFTAGFGTPTYQNSQSLPNKFASGGITINPPVFSPDNDGYNDICFIFYEMSQPNYVANISIYDLNGTEIRKLFNNITLSQKGYLTWDGLGENNKSLPAGLYIIYTTLFNLQGKTISYKNVVTLAKR